MYGTGLGALEIQMLLDLLPMKKQLDEAKSLLGQGTSSMAGVVKGAMAGLAGVLSVGMFAGWVKGSIDAMEGLKDLSIQTGVSVEALSAMAAIGKTTGTSAETIGGAMNKLAKNMAVANEESKGTGQALKALGLNFDQFKALKGDQQMLAMAQAMAKFEDGTGKSAVAMTLMGKEGAKLLPYMADLAREGKLVATVTTEQAEAADEFNDAVSRSGLAVDNFKRGMANALLPTMSGLLDLTTTLGRQIGDYLSGSTRDATMRFDAMGFVIRAVGTVMETLVVMASEVGFVFTSIGNTLGGFAAQVVQLVQGNFAAVGVINDEMKARNSSARAELDKFQASVLGTTDRILANRDALATHGLGAAENNREMAALGGRYGNTGKDVLAFSAAGEEGAKKQADAHAKLLESYGKVANATALKLAEQQHELESGQKLSEAEKDYIKIMLDVRDGKSTLAEVTRNGTLALLQANIAQAQGIELSKEEAKWMAETAKANDSYHESLARTTEGLADQVARQREANAAIGMTAEQLVARQAAADRDSAAALENRAAWAEDVDWSGQMSASLRTQADLLRERAKLTEDGVIIKEAKAAAEAWARVSEEIGAGLTDALMRAFEGGGNFFAKLWQGIKHTFASQALNLTVNTVQGGITSLVAGAIGAQQPAGYGGTSGLISAGGSLSSLYNLGSGGFGAVSSPYLNAAYGYLTTGSAVGTTATNAALIESASGTAGYGASSASAAGSAGSWGGTAGTAAGAAGGMIIGNQISDGQGILGNDSSFAVSIGTAIGSFWGPIGATIGGALGGVVNKWFGQGNDEVLRSGVAGTFTGGALQDGRNYAQIHQGTGGYRWDNAALGTGEAAALAAGAKAIYTQATEYGKALGLPVEQLVRVRHDMVVDLGADAQANASAIAKAVNAYGDALVATYGDALKTVRLNGETTLQTMERLGAALTVTNTAFGNLGLQLLDASIAGGKAAANIVGLTGGLEAFVQKTSAYMQGYFSEAEQTAMLAQGIRQQLAAAGLGGLLDTADSRDDLRTLLEAANPSTAAGQAQIGGLLNVAQDFAKVADYLDANGLRLSDLAATAPGSVLALQDERASRPADPDRAYALAVASNEQLSSIASNSTATVTHLQALVTATVETGTQVLRAINGKAAALGEIDRQARLADLAMP